MFRSVSLALQAGMWVAYLVAFVVIVRWRDGAGERTAMRIVVAGAAVASVALILTPPALSSDLYHYALFGRMIITRGLNPYVTPGGVLVDDPLWPLANWHDYPTHYGPVFTGLSVIAAWAGAGSAVGTALAFKTLATAFGALTVWAAAALARREGRSSLLPVLLVAWNPIALIETAGSGHNEMVMMGLALAGMYLMRQGRTNLGFVLLVCSVHVKWVTAALLGLALVAHASRHRRRAARAPGRWQSWLRLPPRVTIVLYAPFWAGADSMAAVRRLLIASPNASASDTERLGQRARLRCAGHRRDSRRRAPRSSFHARHGRVGERRLRAVRVPVDLPVVPAARDPLAAVGPLSRTNGCLLVGVTACSVY